MTEEEIKSEIARLQKTAAERAVFRTPPIKRLRRSSDLPAVVEALEREELDKRQPRIAFLERKLARIVARRPKQ